MFMYVRMYIFVTEHQCNFDADPDLDPTFHFYADPPPDPHV
jgi:hypothetical protein